MGRRSNKLATRTHSVSPVERKVTRGWAALGFAGVVIGTALIWAETAVESTKFSYAMLLTGVALVFTGLLTFVALLIRWAHSHLE